MIIRNEEVGEQASIRQLTEAAFAGAEHSCGTEGAIIDALRDAQALTVSLVAVQDGKLLGHVAFSPVRIDDRLCGWYGLGPVSVRPDRQRQGIGCALIREGLARLRAHRARGCVVLGDPKYYRRFGFMHDADLRLAGVPPEYFMRLTMNGEAPSGRVTYHQGFNAA
jgi:putative acetyltransferase